MPRKFVLIGGKILANLVLLGIHTGSYFGKKAVWSDAEARLERQQKNRPISVFHNSETILKFLKNIQGTKYRQQVRTPKSHVGGNAICQKNFVTLLLSTVGGILFAVGMCMCLLPVWNAFTQGVVIAAAGAVVLLAMLITRRRMGGKPIVIKASGKTVGSLILGIAGALTLGVGMCMVMVWNMMVWGILVGVAGIVLLLCLIPLIKGLQ